MYGEVKRPWMGLQRSLEEHSLYQSARVPGVED